VFRGQIQPTIIEKGFKGDRLNEQYAIFKEQARTGEYSLDTSPVGTLSGTYSGNATNLGTDQRIGGFRKALGLTSKEGLMNVINHHLGSGLKDFVGKRDI